MDFLRLGAFDTAHAKWEANDDLLDLLLANDAMKVSEIIFLILAMKCFQALSGDAERIGNGDADAPRAHVEAEDPGLVLKRHNRIIEGYASRFPDQDAVSGSPRIPIGGWSWGATKHCRGRAPRAESFPQRRVLSGGRACPREEESASVNPSQQLAE